MAQKVLLIGFDSNAEGANVGVLSRMLENFGIKSDVVPHVRFANATGSNVSTAKAWLVAKGYSAVIVYDKRHAEDTDTDSFIYSLIPNASAGDVPIGIFGAASGGSGANTRPARLSADANFPLINFDNTNVSGTGFALQSYSSGDQGKKLGTRVIETLTGKKFWARALNYIYPSSPTSHGAYKLDLTKLAAQGSNAEIVFSLDTSFYAGADSSICLGFRYGPHYFLPSLATERNLKPFSQPDNWVYNIGHIFVLWFLNKVGVKPAASVGKMPITLDLDHPIESLGASAPSPRQMKAAYQTWRLIWDFLKSRGGAMQNHILTGGKQAGSGYHWHFRSLSEDFQSLHNLILEEHQKGYDGVFSGAQHTHYGLYGQSTGTFVRHSGGTYGYPANVAQFGTNQSIANFAIQDPAAYALVEEGQRLEMLALGYPDAYAGVHKYCCNPLNAFYASDFLDFHANSGRVKIFRVTDAKQFSGSGIATSANPVYKKDLRFADHRGVHLVYSQDMTTNAYFGAYTALTGGSTTLNSVYTLGASSDTDAWGRFWALQMDLLFTRLVYHGAIPFTHGQACYLADPVHAGDAFIGAGNFNLLWSLIQHLDEWAQLLPDWFEWGSISDVIVWRNRVKRWIGTS